MRIDKSDPIVGSFRAPLAGSWAGSATAIGVGLDVNGRVVAGAGQTGILGILCRPQKAAALEVIDVLHLGQLVEFGGVAGTVYTANTSTGEITSAAVSATQVPVGFTVEADRLVVKVTKIGADLT